MSACWHLPAPGQFSVTHLKTFGAPDLFGHEPHAPLLQGGDGALYGTCSAGEGGTRGVVFRVDRDGSRYVILHAFTGAGGDGANPVAGLLDASDGLLYGTTREGGGTGQGTVFSLRRNGSDFRVLRSFGGGTDDGANPYAALIESREGVLFGTTHLGGASNQGTVFRLDKDGSGYRLIHTFTSQNGDGSQPAARLLEATDGALYGSTYFGGTANLGTIFRLNQDGTGFQVLHQFTGTAGDGAQPYGGLVEGRDGALYGTTRYGGTANLGTVFTLPKDGAGFRSLHHFTAAEANGAEPYSELLQDSEGILYGTTAVGGSHYLGTVFRIGADGSGFRLLHSFTGPGDDGSIPYAGVVTGRDGALYGATVNGGGGDVGSLFKLNRDGSGYATLRSFSRTGGDGAQAYAPVTEASDGWLYGTTWGGGQSDGGTLYRIARDGSGFAIVRNFTGHDGEGVLPYAGVIEGTDGALYGTTVIGGTGRRGCLFRIDKNGSGYLVLKSFSGLNGDGALPYAGLLEGSDRALYGVTRNGGSRDLGTLFRLDRDGSGFRYLRSFTGTPGDGALPFARLTEGRDGLLYGTTGAGGSADQGTVFRLQRDGSGYQVLRTFGQAIGDGAGAYTGVIEGTDGALYGTTNAGGTTNQGTVFRLNKDGSGYAVLHSFRPETGDGARPSGGLVEGIDGNLYGTTYLGGTANEGTIFRLARDGTGFLVVHSLGATIKAGSNPFASVARGSDGALYGTTFAGGVGFGSVFRVAPAAALTVERNGTLTLTGPPGYGFAIQFRDEHHGPGPWQHLTRTTIAQTPFHWTDPAFASGPRRFYQAVLEP